MSSLQLRNPHSILAVLKTRPQDVLEIFVSEKVSAAKPDPADGWSNVLQLAKARKVKIQPLRAPRPVRGASADESGRLSSSHAVIKEKDSITAEELFKGARDKAKGAGIWLALDCLQDPQNVGAIFRNASFFGVQGILVTQERSSPLSSVVYDIASGGMDTVPFCEQINLQRAFELAKEEGLWILGTSEKAEQSISQIKRDRPWLVVLGNEEKGMRRLTQEACDVMCTIPSVGGASNGASVTSLNVSVASGIILSHLQLS